MLAKSINILFAASGLPLPTNSLMCTSIPMIKRIVARSDYVAIVSDHVVETETRSNTLKRVYIKQAGIRQICARYRTGFENPALERFRLILLEASRAARSL